MKGVICHGIGPASEVLSIENDLPRPSLKVGHVLVEVHATSVNPIDVKTRNGEVPNFLVKFPRILGGDLSGIVIESRSSSFPPGTNVIALTEGFNFRDAGQGCYCEYVSVPENLLVKLPESMDMVLAAGIPLVSVTALMALDSCMLKAGSHLLIVGGAGGVGTMCLQLARERGLEVTTTCSSRNVEFCKELGATHVIPYDEKNFWDDAVVGSYDAIIDLIGGDNELQGLKILKPTGTFVSVLNSGMTKKHGKVLGMLRTSVHIPLTKLKAFMGIGPAYRIIMVRPNASMLLKVIDSLEKGTIHPVVSEVLQLEDAVRAHQLIEAGKNSRGKIILQIK